MTRALALTGFLGSGKTTLALALADALLAQGQRVAIIQNERGEIGVDGAFLEAQGLNVRELRAGCVCCELTLPLHQTVILLREQYQPDWLLLEASGVANADALRQTLEQTPVAGVVWQFIALLDTARFAQLWQARYGLGLLVRPQVAQADALVLTKIARVSEARLLEIAEQVQALRPDAPLLPFLPDDPESVTALLGALATPAAA